MLDTGPVEAAQGTILPVQATLGRMHANGSSNCVVPNAFSTRHGSKHEHKSNGVRDLLAGQQLSKCARSARGTATVETS
jgi:hypothetical protein